MEEYKGYNINIEYDEYSESPREWDNLGIMVVFHNRYNLGDNNHNIKENEYYSDKLGDYVYCNNWEDVKEQILEVYPDAILIKPLYLLDHSGITISMSDYCDKWDSGQVGFYFTTKKRIREEFDCKHITKKTMLKAENILKEEVNTYDQYLRGDVYSIDVLDVDGESIECVSGFYGYDYALEEGQRIVDYTIMNKQESNIQKLKAYIINHVPLEKRVLLS